MNPDENPSRQDLDSLEETSTVVESSPSDSSTTDATSGDASGNSLESSDGGSTPPPVAPPPQKGNPLKRLIRRFNVYLLLFGLVLLIGVAVTIVAITANNSAAKKPSIATQSLSDQTLKQLANSDVTVGDPKQVLNVQSSAVFAGKVLIRDSLEVAGPIKVGGSLTLPGITVSGVSSFDQVQVSGTMGIGGNTTIQGQLNVQKSLTVNGSGTFNGTLTASQFNASSLQLNGDLTLNHHLVAGGTTPGRSTGSALGGGGTVSVSGSDSGGSININTGSGPAAGCFITVNFAQKYNATPHVLVTPVGSAAGGLPYYITRSTSSFSVCTTAPAPANQNFGYDYFVVG